MSLDKPLVTCHVLPHYMAEQSEPDNGRYVFSYTVTIKNLGQQQVQLLRRFWLITDSNQKELVINGEGVIGEQPVIASKNEHRYTSATAIETPLGTMQGHYTMIDHLGEEFNVEIEPFLLAIPNIIN
ncbi:Co2+/Mg2+ efflux protein ApaG [Aliivibrio kagoshimensis]|uniref:Co2+/Mg2+ efflux protein ApaG n=1 Tax=Aliivibrio kagoshimensis TaxID=2910230 RepID=UPI003D0AE091